MIVGVAVVVGVFAVLLVAIAVVGADERISSRATCTRLVDYDSEIPTWEKELGDPFAERVLTPAFGWLVAVAKRLVPAEYARNVKHKLVLAGRSQPDDLDRYLVIQVLAVAAVPVLAFAVWRYTSIQGLELWAILVMIAFGGILGPDASLNRTVADRQEKIRNKLPDVLDLLTISVEAGLGFEQALGRVVAMVPGPLAQEFSRLLGEMRAGSSRADAMTALDERTDVEELRSFILAMLQADTFGISVGSILRSQAQEMRIRRQQRAQEKAQKAPVKMLFPMVFCIMPALFVIIAGPAVIGIYHAFHS